MLRFAATGTTHVGLVRASNQDSAVFTSHLLLVADGVGGGAAGEVASATATHAVREALLEAGEALPHVALATAVHRAQEQVALAIDADPTREGMATTLTAVWLHRDDAAIVHLGDSRAYVHRGEELLQITRDHTWTERAIQRGALSEDDAAVHPWRNVILRSINGAPEQGDLLPLALRPGDRLLLASDGLTDLVAPAWIEQLVEEHEDDEALVHGLVAAALAQGGRDNVTVLVATLLDTPASTLESPCFLGAAAEEEHVVRGLDVRDAENPPPGPSGVTDSSP